MADDLIQITINVKNNADEATRDLNQLEGALGNTTKATSQAAIAAQKYAGAQRLAGKTTNRFGMYSQQVGYQVGDFLVQVQGGTDALLAFGQQGTQLAGLLPGLAGAIIGIGLSLATALGGSAMRAKELSFDFKKMGADLLVALQPISPLIEAVSSALGVVANAAADFGMILLNNLDRAVIYLGTFATFLMTKWVTAFAVARVSTLSLAGALATLSKALISTGIGALVVLAGELVYALVSAIRATGGFKSAVLSLWDSAKFVLDKIKDGFSLVALSVNAASLSMEAFFNRALVKMMSAFAEFTWTVADGLNGLFGTELMGLGFGPTNQMALETKDLEDRAKAAVDAVKSLYAAWSKGPDGQTTNNIDPSTWFKPDDDGDDDKGKGKGESALAQLLEEQRQRKILLGLTGQERMLKEEIFAVTKKLGDEAKLLSDKQIEALAKVNLGLTTQEELYKSLVERVQGVSDTIESSMTSAFMSIVDGTKSAKDAFKDMARQIIAELYRVLVVQRLVGSFDAASGKGSGIVGSIMGAFGGANANGNAFFGGRVTPFANGGVVNGPTMFPMSGGQTGLMGEAGPEAIMPLKRDKNGRLGVSVDGGSGAVNVVNNINVTGGSDPAAIRMEVAKLMPQITNATKTAVIDARRRGGQMKAAFG
jgi:hypothetical protein